MLKDLRSMHCLRHKWLAACKDGGCDPVNGSQNSERNRRSFDAQYKMEDKTSD